MMAKIALFELYKKAYEYKTNRCALDLICDDIRRGYDRIKREFASYSDKQADLIERESAIFGYKVDAAPEIIDSRIHRVADFLENVDISKKNEITYF